MKSLGYWMAFQVLIGIWLFVSPFVMGFREMTQLAFNNMVFGAVVAILGLSVSLYEYHHRESTSRMEHVEKKSS